MTTSTSAHVLVFPYPAQGHMLPMLDLTHLLVLRGLTITILITPKNLHILNPLLSKHPTQIQTLVLPFPSHPSIPPGVENVKDLPIFGFRAMMCALGELFNPIVDWFQSHPSPPIAIISDMFLGWTHELAIQLGIKRLVFSPSGAYTISVINSLWRNMPKRNNPNDENALFSFLDIPSSPEYRWYQLSTVYRGFVEGDPDWEFVKKGMLANAVSWGYVFNTFSDLESVYLNHLKKELGHDRVLSVGPLLPADGHNERGGSSSVEVNDLLSWLDTCADRSVVYVCFGSQAVLTNEQMEALANGLEKSGSRFVWSVKEPTKGHVEGEYGRLPTGFEDRVVGRGYVIKGWAPQVVILNHKAIGSFLTHCGWNSVLEAIVAGVPMLTWPMGADQFINARILVEQEKVAVGICEGAKTVPDADEVARKVAESVDQKCIMSERAGKLKQAALAAVKNGGSSFLDLDGLVRMLGDSNSLLK